MPFFNIVAATNENTVVTEYEPEKARSESYQSEAEQRKNLFVCSVSRAMNICIFITKKI